MSTPYTLCVQVGLPYVRAKLQDLYQRQQRVRGQPLLGTTAGAAAPTAPAGGGLAGSSSSRRRTAWLAALRAHAAAAYPWVHAAAEGAALACQLAYLLQGPSGSAPAPYSPGLALLRQRVVRVAAREAAERQREVAAARARTLRTASASHGGALAAGLLRAGHLLADHTRTALIASVFGFKVRAERRGCRRS